MTPVRCAVLCSLLAAPLAFGQSTVSAPVSSAPPVVQIQKIVVAETLLAADAAGQTNVRFETTTPATTRTLSNLAERVANFHISTGGAGSFGDIVTLRGLPNTPFFSDPSVTLYFDDLPLGSAFTYPTGLFGFASATVRRGPQGTAFGRGGEAGVITLHSAEPEQQAAGEFRASAGSYAQHAGAFEVRTAHGDKADATVSGSFLERDGYIRNTTLGENVDDQLGWSGAARLRLRPNTTSEFTLQLLGSRRRDGAQPLSPLGGPLFSVARGREGSTDNDFGGIALKGAFDTSLGHLASTTSYTDWKLSPYSNRLTLPPTLDSRIDQTQRIWNEELRLASGPRALVTWHAGAWFSDGETRGEVNRGLVIPTTTIPVEVSRFTLDGRTAAVFGEVTVPPQIGWSVTAGLRLEETKKEFDRGQTVPGPGRFTAEKTFQAVLPKLSVSYALTNDTTATATFALGTKPGGWSAYTGNAALAGFRAEKTRAFEAGVDTSFDEKSFTIAGRVFLYDVRDYQIERSFNAQDYLVVNAPKARSQGAELELARRFSSEFTVTATLGWTDVELRQFTDPFTGVRYDGKRAPYTPEYEAHLGATYRAKGGLIAAAELVATGETFFDESENQAFAAGAHRVVNARLGYDAERWRVSFFGENITDEAYYSLIVPGVRHGTPGAPRRWGVEAVLKW